MQHIISALRDIESYCTTTLGYDTATAYFKQESDGKVELWIRAADTFIQKAPYDDQVFQINNYQVGDSWEEVREASWEYLYKQAKPRDEREFAFAMRRMATLADSQFSTFVGQFIAGKMKAAIEEAGRLLEAPRPEVGQ